MTPDAWFDRLGGRKFIMGLLAIILGFILSLMGKLSPEFTGILIASYGFFNYANTVTTVASLKASPQPDSDKSNA